MNIFERASRQKLRFNTTIGLLSTDDLWDLPLVRTGRSGTSLDEIAQTVNTNRESAPVVSFVAPVESPETSILDLQLDILKHIIASKLADQQKAEKALETKRKKEKLLAALARKQDEAVDNMTEDELRAALDEL